MASNDKGKWEWYEDWLESNPDHPRECEKAGWACSNCGIDLSEYLTEALGELVYADNIDNPPKLKFCPCCGKLMEVQDGE